VNNLRQQHISRSEPISIAVFTAAPWESAVVVLRIIGPAEMAGMRIHKGNQGPQISLEAISKADVVVIQRDFPRFWEDYRQVIKQAREVGKPLIYDLDDLLVDIPDDHSHQADYVGEMLTMLYAILDADIVTSSSPILHNYLAELNPNSKLINNYLVDSFWGMEKPKITSITDPFVTIGYMGGQTHQSDLENIKNALLNVFRKYPEKVRYKFWGTQPPGELLDLAITEYDPINLEDYARFASYFSRKECDIFIAPLVDNEFNRAKSNLKFLEYSIQGVPGVYSKLPPYEDIIEHGTNGFLAEDIDEWEAHLENLIRDPSLRNKIGSAAQQTVKDGWLLSSNYSEFMDVYMQALEGEEKRAKVGKLDKNLRTIISHAEDYQSDLEERLFAAQNQLNEIHNSRSWKILKQIQKMRLKIIPKR
jgi:glycosyltransferase involved in cell wall biosynthesis